MKKSRFKIVGEYVPKKQNFFSRYIDTRPLYVRWDGQTHSLILCNRFLPFKETIITKWLNKHHSMKKIDHVGFITWPMNLQSRRRCSYDIRYNTRTTLVRRRSMEKKNAVIKNLNVLSHHKSYWRRIAMNWETSIFAFWLAPWFTIPDRFILAFDKNYKVRPSPEETTLGFSPDRSVINQFSTRNQNFPFSFQRSFRSRTYIPRYQQPVTRGGLVWPSTNPSLFFLKEYVINKSSY